MHVITGVEVPREQDTHLHCLPLHAQSLTGTWWMCPEYMHKEIKKREQK